MNWDLSLVERIELLLVVVNQDDLMTHVSKTRARHQSDISRSHYGDVHPNLPL